MATFSWAGKTLKPHTDISWRDINGDLVALNVKTGEYFVFNEIGRLVWLAITEGLDAATTLQKIVDEYDVSGQDASRDVDVFVQALCSKSIVEEA